jgi:hypothetical protein
LSRGGNVADKRIAIPIRIAASGFENNYFWHKNTINQLSFCVAFDELIATKKKAQHLSSHHNSWIF